MWSWSSRPRESASELSWDELLGLFVILLGLGVLCLLALFHFGIVLLGLLAGPQLGGCRILDMLLIWLLLMMVFFWRMLLVVLVRGVHWVSGSGPGRKRIRLNRKTPAHLAVYVVQSRPRVWKRLRHVGPFLCFHS